MTFALFASLRFQSRLGEMCYLKKLEGAKPLLNPPMTENSAPDIA